MTSGALPVSPFPFAWKGASRSMPTGRSHRTKHKSHARARPCFRFAMREQACSSPRLRRSCVVHSGGLRARPARARAPDPVPAQGLARRVERGDGRHEAAGAQVAGRDGVGALSRHPGLDLAPALTSAWSALPPRGTRSGAPGNPASRLLPGGSRRELAVQRHGRGSSAAGMNVATAIPTPRAPSLPCAASRTRLVLTLRER